MYNFWLKIMKKSAILIVGFLLEMKQRFEILIIFSLVAGLTLPGLFTALKAKPAVAGAAPAQDISQPVVTVVNRPQTAKVSVANAQSSSLSCASKAGSTNNLAQDAGVVNLNQPAACFSLSLGAAVSYAALKVQPLKALQPKILVRQNQPLISNPDLSQAPLSQNFPAVPVSAVVVFMALIDLERKLKSKNLLSMDLASKLNQKFYRPLVLRC